MMLQQIGFITRMRWRLGIIVVLLAGCGAREMAGASTQPILHPNLADAMASGFQVVVGHAPFTIQFWVENGAGYQAQWDAGGAIATAANAGAGIVARYDRPGVYYPSVRLTAGGWPSVTRPQGGATLRQKIVVLGEPAAGPGGKYGVNQDVAWDWPAQRGPEIALMKAAGVGWLRMPIRWSWVEPQAGTYAWGGVDPAVDQANSAGLHVLAVLGGTPAWSSGVAQKSLAKDVYADAFAPRRTSDFAGYVYETVQHFRGRVPAYELFNEPNSINHWRPAPNATRFVELLCAGYYAAKYADPSSVIVAGGLNGNGLFLGWEPAGSRDFLKAIYGGPGANCFDVMAIHPYAHPTENGLAGLQSWVDQTRAYMRAQGDGRELWLTEVGWSTGPHLWGKATISEQQQAEWVTAVYRDLAGPQKVFWYNFKDVAGPTMADPEYHWGWLRYDLTAKAAFGSFQGLQK